MKEIQGKSILVWVKARAWVIGSQLYVQLIRIAYTDFKDFLGLTSTLMDQYIVIVEIQNDLFIFNQQRWY